jgi:hypothetical protein
MAGKRLKLDAGLRPVKKLTNLPGPTAAAGLCDGWKKVFKLLPALAG